MNSEHRPLGEAADRVQVEVGDAQRGTDPWIGRVIAHRYKLVEHLAEGGMGTVYVAEHLTLGKEVALKTIHPDLAGDEELAERFAREAMATAKLEHPHVASALDYGRLPEGGAFLVMQLVRGPSLHDVLDQEGRVGWPRACAIGAQVADALAAAHAVGIIHRDLKPENVLLEPRDDGSELVKVLDFGIARIGDDLASTMSSSPRTSGHRLTRRGTVMGTPGYMSPEQALGETIDARTDIYALGILLWESIAGQALWSGETLTDIVAEQLGAKKIANLCELTGDATIPAELQELIAQMLARHPSDRPESAALVRDRLRDLALRASVAGDPRARLTPPAGLPALYDRADPVHAPPVAAEALRQAPAPRRLSGTVALGALALLIVLGLGGYLLWDRSPPPEEDAELMQAIYERAQAATRAEELSRQIGQLLHEDSRDLRRAASSYILDYEPADDVPEPIRALAQLELASGCDELRAALGTVREVGDPSLSEAVERRFPLVWRRGMRRDLYRCVRSEIEQILAAWESSAGEIE